MEFDGKFAFIDDVEMLTFAECQKLISVDESVVLKKPERFAEDKIMLGDKEKTVTGLVDDLIFRPKVDHVRGLVQVRDFEDKLLSIGIGVGENDEEVRQSAVLNACQAALISIGFDGHTRQPIEYDKGIMTESAENLLARGFVFHTITAPDYAFCVAMDPLEQVRFAYSIVWGSEYNENTVSSTIVELFNKEDVDCDSYAHGCTKCKMKDAICACIVNYFAKFPDIVCYRLMAIKYDWHEAMSSATKKFKIAIDRIYSISTFLRIYCQWIGKLCSPKEAAIGFIIKFMFDKGFYDYTRCYLFAASKAEYERQSVISKRYDIPIGAIPEVMFTGLGVCVNVTMNVNSYLVLSPCKCWCCSGLDTKISTKEFRWIKPNTTKRGKYKI